MGVEDGRRVELAAPADAVAVEEQVIPECPRHSLAGRAVIRQQFLTVAEIHDAPGVPEGLIVSVEDAW